MYFNFLHPLNINSHTTTPGITKLLKSIVVNDVHPSNILCTYLTLEVSKELKSNEFNE